MAALWCLLYYNYVGTQLLCIFTKTAWEMYGDADVTDKLVRPMPFYFGGNVSAGMPTASAEG